MIGHSAEDGSIPVPDVSALIARLEAAEAGSRELDHAIRDALNDPHWNIRVPADWSTSLDAALALADRVLPGWYVGVQQNRYLLSTGPEWSAYLLGPEPKSPEIEGDGRTAALAMCIAVLYVIQHGYEAAGEVSPILKAKAQGEGG